MADQKPAPEKKDGFTIEEVETEVGDVAGGNCMMCSSCSSCSQTGCGGCGPTPLEQE